jgi:hypothetical protein
VRFRRLLPQVWVRLAVVTARCSRIPSSDDGLIVVCSVSRDECAVGQPMAARLLLTQPGWPTDCTCRGRRNRTLSAADVVEMQRRLTNCQSLFNKPVSICGPSGHI